MSILDYIFKSKEQREQEAKEAEERHDSEVFSKADKLRAEGKKDEALELYLQLVNKRYRGCGFWYAYTRACGILWDQKRYTEILDVVKKYERWYDRDADNSMDWYESWAKKMIEEQEEEKKKPKEPVKQEQPKQTAQPKPQTQQTKPQPSQPKQQTQSKPVPAQGTQIVAPKPAPTPKPQPVAPAKPKAQTSIWEDDGPFIIKPCYPKYRHKFEFSKDEQLYTKYRNAIESLPPYSFYTAGTETPSQPVNALARYYRDVQEELDEAERNCRDEDYKSAAEIYELLIGHRYWKPEPYMALIAIYEQAKMHDVAQEVRQEALHHFTSIQQRMRAELLAAAHKIDADDLAYDIILRGEKVEYYMGIYTVYDPFPCIEQWKRELAQNA